MDYACLLMESEKKKTFNNAFVCTASHSLHEKSTNTFVLHVYVASARFFNGPQYGQQDGRDTGTFGQDT